MRVQRRGPLVICVLAAFASGFLSGKLPSQSVPRDPSASMDMWVRTVDAVGTANALSLLDDAGCEYSDETRDLYRFAYLVNSASRRKIVARSIGSIDTTEGLYWAYYKLGFYKDGDLLGFVRAIKSRSPLYAALSDNEFRTELNSRAVDLERANYELHVFLLKELFLCDQERIPDFRPSLFPDGSAPSMFGKP